MPRRKQPEPLVSLSEAGRVLKVSRQALRKHLDRAPELNHGTAARPKVRVKELRGWRKSNCNPAKRNGSASHLAEPDAATADAPAAGAAARADELPEISDGITFNEARRRREVLRARNEEIAYRKSSGELISKAEALEIIGGAARFLREGWHTRARRLGTQLASARTAPERIRMLEAEYDALLTELADRYGS